MDPTSPDRGADPGPYRFDPGESAALAVARARVLERIEHACRRVGRSPEDVQLVAVSKIVPAERLRAATAAGLTVLGENQVREAEGKAEAVPGVTWHLVGVLQSNKARRAVETFDVVQSVDSRALAERLSRICGEVRPGRPLRVLLQVNVDADPRKAGFAAAALRADLPDLLALPNLEVHGLMTVGRLVDDAEAARGTYVALRRLSEELRRAAPGLGPGLSMGMTDDYPVAVEEGATIVRVGRAIFGERPHAHGAEEHTHAPGQAHLHDAAGGHSHDAAEPDGPLG